MTKKEYEEAKAKIAKVTLNPFERKALNSLIADTAYSAVQSGMNDQLINELMEIITNAYILGVVSARQSNIPKPSMN